jgi:CheY-like chemotaxis protein
MTLEREFPMVELRECPNRVTLCRFTACGAARVEGFDHRNAAFVTRTPDTTRPGGPFVLLIDDDNDSLEIVRQTLEWAGIPVQTANRGAAGLRIAISDPPAAALIDLNMPGMSGIDVLRELRANERTSDVAAVALTGVPELLDTVTDIRFDRVLTKPVPQDDLIRVVRSLMTAPGTKDTPPARTRGRAGGYRE